MTQYGKRIKATLLATSLVAVAVQSPAVAAGHDFWHKMKLGFYRNTAWPDPFNEADAMDAVRPFEVMKQNGWRVHNTIGHELFRPTDGVLSAAGQNRVRWIVTQAPQNHREIHVLRGIDQAETDARIASVRATVDAIVPTGMPPQIFVTTIQPPTAPGNFATKINRDRLEQMTPPKLPSTTASGTQGIAP